jgi:hypothetical protein
VLRVFPVQGHGQQQVTKEFHPPMTAFSGSPLDFEAVMSRKNYLFILHVGTTLVCHEPKFWSYNSAELFKGFH